jgi:LuxR family transcriptional regulator of csgAB operon
MQNELLIGHINESTGLDCFSVGCVEQFPAGLDKSDSKKLVLFDCLGINNPELLESIKSCPLADTEHVVRALMNLDPEKSVEGEALQLGICGFFYEQDSLATLIKGIEAIFSGEVWISRQKMIDCFMHDKELLHPLEEKTTTVLTRREEEILRFLARGVTNESIAEALCISPHTVRTHNYNIFKKINVPNRLQASLWAAKYL